MKNLVNKLFKEEKGQGMTEYGLILGLIAIVVIAVVTLMGTELKEKFQGIVDGLTGTAANSTSTETTTTTP